MRRRRPACGLRGARRRVRERQRRHRRRAARLPTSPASTTCPRCSTAPASAPRPSASTIDFRDGDAEALPFADASFDATITVVGSMFAPDHHKAAAELVRVTKPGGTIGLVSWRPSGFVGDIFRTTGKHVPPPAGVASPLLWGTEEHVAELFGDDVAWTHRERIFTWRFTSPAALVDVLRDVLRADREGARGRRRGQRCAAAGPRAARRVGRRAAASPARSRIAGDVPRVGRPAGLMPSVL